MKVLMLPQLKNFQREESGIKRVVEAYHKYAPQFGIEFVDCNVEDEGAYDVYAVHAGTSNKYPVHRPIVAILHGLYWSDDLICNVWEYRANANVIESVRRATVITVPSPWVAETIMRDFRVRPMVVPHGIEVGEWDNNREHDGYVLWNKNRSGDVCDPTPVRELANRFPDVKFLTTFAPPHSPENVTQIGVLPHSQMADIIKGAMVYLSSTKETFGIGILEALAAGVPVLGFRAGGNTLLVQHGINGYLARTNDYSGLAKGLDYIMRNRKSLSKNSAITAKRYTWENSLNKLKQAFELAEKLHFYDRVELNLDESEYRRGE